MRHIRYLCVLIFISISIIAISEFVLTTWDIATNQIVDPKLRRLLYSETSPVHPHLEYTSRKNYRGKIPHFASGDAWQTEINSNGFRTGEFYPKLPGTKRVLIMGDSFMWGYGANQSETPAVVLEELLRERMSKKIEVFSLAIPSYSAVRYSVLSDLYFDVLDPDLVIVALDDSDFEEDLRRIHDYVLHDDGAPYYLKNAEDLLEEIRDQRYVIDKEREVQDLENPDVMLNLYLGYSLYRRLLELNQWFDKLREARAPIENNAGDQEYSVVTYDDLLQQYGEHLPTQELGGPVIPYDLSTSITRYRPTLNSLKHIKRLAAERNIELVLSAYPYPWKVSVTSSIPFQLQHFGKVFDFRNHRVHAQVIAEYARIIDAPFVDAYPRFERSKAENYHQNDPHFNAAGYRLFAQVLNDYIVNNFSPDLAIQTN